MMFAKQKKFRRSLLALCVTGLIAGCGGGSDAGPGPVLGGQEQPSDTGPVVMAGVVRGSVITDGPVAGAQITLLTPDGQALLGTTQTDAEGNFTLSTTDARSQMQIVAKGGVTSEGQASQGTLSAFVRDFKSEAENPLTPVTTLANRIRIAMGSDAVQAEMRTADYLAFPPAVSIQADFRDGISFNSTKFMHMANARGLDGLIDEMVAEAVDDKQCTFPGCRTAPLLGALPDLRPEAIAKLLLEKALEFLKRDDQPIGIWLKTIFGEDDEIDVAAEFKKLNQKLDEIIGTVKEIDANVMEMMLDSKTAVLTMHMNDIATVWNNIQLAQSVFGDNPDELRKRFDIIFNGDQLKRIEENKELIKNVFEGSLVTGQDPLNVYYRFMKKKYRFYSDRNRLEHDAYISYYEARDLQAYTLIALRNIWQKDFGALKLLQKNVESRAYPKWKSAPLPDPKIFYDWNGKKAWYLMEGSYTIQETTMNRFHGTWCWGRDGQEPCFTYQAQGYSPARNRISSEVRKEILPASLIPLGTWRIPYLEDMSNLGFVASEIEGKGAGPILGDSLKSGSQVWTGSPVRSDYYFANNDFRFQIRTIDFVRGTQEWAHVFDYQRATNEKRRVLAFHPMTEEDEKIYPWNNKRSLAP